MKSNYRTILLERALGLGPLGMAAADERLVLPDGGTISVRDSGLVQLSLLRLAFGFTATCSPSE